MTGPSEKRQRLPAAAAKPDADAIEAEIERVQTLKLDEVRALWRGTFKRDVPQALTRDLLVRTICWHIQEQAFGGHTPAVLRILARYAKGRATETDRLRRLKPGTELVREYQGERHAVVITREGYRWRDQDYPSLTAIARVITGANWNGPRFFGLREDKSDKTPGRADPKKEQGGPNPDTPQRQREVPASGPRKGWVIVPAPPVPLRGGLRPGAKPGGEDSSGG